MARNTHDAIVSEQEYAKAQEVIKHYPLQKPQKEPFQKFRGILKCACCGRVLVRKAGKNPYFICLTARSIKDSDCIKVRLEEAELEEVLLEAIKIQVQLQIEKASDPAEKADSDLQKGIKECRLAVSRQKALQMTAFEDYAEGRISKQEYLSRKQAAAGRQEEMNRRIQTLNDLLAVQQGSLAEPEVNLGKYAFVEELSREVLVELVKEIRVSGENRMEIVWRFCEEVPTYDLPCLKVKT